MPTAVVDESVPRMTGSFDADSPFYVGVDCGATSARAVLTDRDGAVLARARGAGGNLQQGIDRCWAAILAVVAACFEDLPQAFVPAHCRLGVGIAGGHHRPSLDQFEAAAPGFAALVVDTDSFIHLLGAHGGRPGSIAAFGTGSIGESLLADGTRKLVGGYGFPAGDRASGAWLGQQASQHLQDALDGVVRYDELAEALRTAIGQQGREDVLAWLSHATPSAFGGLVPTVLAYRDHPVVRVLLHRMATDAAAMIVALKAHRAGPIALCGGLATVIEPLLSDSLRAGLVAPAGDGAEGALILVRRAVSAG